jgi:hypothetical protein
VFRVINEAVSVLTPFFKKNMAGASSGSRRSDPEYRTASLEERMVSILVQTSESATTNVLDFHVIVRCGQGFKENGLIVSPE